MLKKPTSRLAERAIERFIRILKRAEPALDALRENGGKLLVTATGQRSARERQVVGAKGERLNITDDNIRALKYVAPWLGLPIKISRETRGSAIVHLKAPRQRRTRR